MLKEIIATDKAPAAIGTYSQAVKVGNTVYLSGQIPLVPETMQVVEGNFASHVTQVFRNLQAVCQAAGGELSNIVKLNVLLTDMANFADVNTVMSEFFQAPYPARAAFAVKQLPKDVDIEIEAIMVLD